MAIGRTNAGGGGLSKSILIVTAPTGATLTATLGDTVKTAAEETPGEYWLKNLDLGEWNLKLTLGEQTATTKYTITEFGVYRISMSFFLSAADFIWEGTKGVDYEIVQDDDTVIPAEDYHKYRNWKARILTSITITPLVDGEIDVFFVGAGASGSSRRSNSGNNGAGGGSGRTLTVKKIKITKNEPIAITIGAGGIGGRADKSEFIGNKGGDTEAFGETVKGGDHSTFSSPFMSGGDGGSGGAGRNGEPGINGSDGTGSQPGKGQGTTTREFGEPDGRLYATGGRFGQDTPAEVVPNSGNGGDGANGQKSGDGSSGIVVIRNAREVA